MDPLALDSNLFDLYAHAAAATGLPVDRRQGFSFVAFRPSPWTNTVFDLDFSRFEGLPPGLVEGIRGEVIHNKLRVGPSSRPQDVERRLVEGGFTKVLTSLGMFLDMKRRSPAEVPRALSFGLVTGAEDLLAFAKIVVEELLGGKPESSPAFAQLLGSLARDRTFALLATAGEEPVSTSFGYIDRAGIGGVYFVATRAKHRGLGYGSAVVGATLDELDRRGVGECILHATDLGRPVYEGLGFVAACPLSQYFLREGAGS
jgi:GNAT superfamily N-acetyltransferase